MTDQEIALQRRAARIVSQEVNACLSSLVATLAGGYGLSQFQNGGNRNAVGASPAYAALDDLAAQALELAAPVLDYESAARQAGWIAGSVVGVHRSLDGDAFSTGGVTEWSDSWRLLCEAHNIEPHDCEVYEHWAVSQWLAEKLIAKGERVDTDFAGLNVWARTTAGQAISIDAVIEAITTETGYASEA